MVSVPEESPSLSSEPSSLGEEPPPLHRLFVGSVPRTVVEATLRSFFEQCGDVGDLAILRDRSSGKSRGCAFVSYLQLEQAEEAIRRFDRQLILPGAQVPLEVRFAKNHSYVQAGSGPSGNRQLFFSRVPLQLKEEDVLPLFLEHGDVESLNIFKCRRSGRSKGCGFVEMQTREAAISAMEHLDERHVFDATGTAISVRWADPELQHRKKKAMDDANADNRMLFFAKVLRSTTEDDVRRLFSQFGKVHDVNLFRAFQGAPTTKGCGLVTMSVHTEAVAAITSLDGKFTWEGMDCPMVVKWMDTALQRRRREQHLASIRHPLPSTSIGGILGGQRTPEQLNYQSALMPSMPTLMPLGGATVATAALPTGGPYSMVQPPGALGAGTAAAAGALGMGVGMGMGVLGAGGAMGGGLAGLGGAGDVLEPALETPPPGCNPDAIKLFVGNVPKSCTEEQLLPLFQSIGKVVELVIVYDKVTHESKGSGFVWYETRADAERAIIQFNLRHVFPDPSGAQDRPLVVRRAKARSRGLGAPGAFATALGQMSPSGLVASPYLPRMMGFGMGAMASHPMGVGAGMGGGLSVASLQAGMEGLQLVDGGAAAGGMAGGMGMGMGAQHVAAAGQHAAAGLMHASAAGGGGERGMPGIITIGPSGGQAAGIYHAYAADDQLQPDYSTAATAHGAPNAAAGAGSGTYPMMLAAATGAVMAPGGGAASAGSSNHWDASGGLRSHMAVSLTLNAAQLGAVNQHLFSVQTVSGATLQLSPGPTGLFHLVISGGKAQVDAARDLLASVIGEAAYSA